jgi:hypothetical protein
MIPEQSRIVATLYFSYDSLKPKSCHTKKNQVDLSPKYHDEKGTHEPPCRTTNEYALSFSKQPSGCSPPTHLYSEVS